MTSRLMGETGTQRPHQSGGRCFAFTIETADVARRQSQDGVVEDRIIGGQQSSRVEHWV